MRIVALGDAHLGRSAENATVRTGSEAGMNQRERDFEESFLAAIDAGLQRSPDAMLWLGDVFDHPRPSYRSFRIAFEALRRVREHGVALLAISGNHDTPRLAGTGSPYGVLSDAFPEFRFAHRMAYERHIVGDVMVHAVPQTRTTEDAILALRDASASRDAQRTNLLITHPLVHGIERRYQDLNEIEVDLIELQSDLVLLGHYHTFQTVRSGVWYAGATDTFSFGDDPHRPKGFVELNTQTGICTHVPLAGQRPLVWLDPVECRGLGPEEVTTAIAARLATVSVGAVARMQLLDIDPSVQRMLDRGALDEGRSHLLAARLDPVFDVAGRVVDDLPEADNLVARWQSFLSTQALPDDEKEAVSRRGQEFIDAATAEAAAP